MNIYVGNLSWDAKDEDLRHLFGHFGRIKSAMVIRDKKTGRSKGFGFVEMESEEQGRIAIEKLNKTLFMDRPLNLNEARPQEG